MNESILITRSGAPKDTLVLVTGGSGFIATHCILLLLEKGYQVRTTIRSSGKEQEILAKLKNGGMEPGSRLTFVTADLMSDKGWDDAVKDCRYVLHLASPFPLGVPKNENELIIPALEGALRVLKASRKAGVSRVVLTSSFAAIGYSSKPSGYLFTEKDWSDPQSPECSAYSKSKTLAERAAWDFMSKEGGEMELVAVNPVMVLGPILGQDDSTSIELVKKLLQGALPGYPHLSFGVVDVRDIADLHFRAMTNPAVKGERFLAIAGGFITMKEIGEVLKRNLGVPAKKVPSREIPDWLVKLVAFVDPSIRQVVPELGKNKNATNEKARQLLNWNPRSPEEAILATAESLLKFGMINK